MHDSKQTSHSTLTCQAALGSALALPPAHDTWVLRSRQFGTRDEGMQRFYLQKLND